MKVIILAGGLGTRLSEETVEKPKPMVLINGTPILWHIMNIFAVQGFNDFLIASGYKGEVISEWASTIEDDWKVEVVNTGLDTQTGGRIKLCMDLYPSEKFLATYGDGVGNINVRELIAFHDSQSGLATLTAVRPPARFGYLDLANGKVKHFGEKNQSNAGWINGGFFVLEPKVANYVHSKDEPFETGALPRLVSESRLNAFEHHGFWQPMDTLREKHDLENLSLKGNPPWLENLEI